MPYVRPPSSFVKRHLSCRFLVLLALQELFSHERAAASRASCSSTSWTPCARRGAATAPTPTAKGCAPPSFLNNESVLLWIPGGESAADGDGRARRSKRRVRHRSHQQAGHHRPGHAAAGAPGQAARGADATDDVLTLSGASGDNHHRRSRCQTPKNVWPSSRSTRATCRSLPASTSAASRATHACRASLALTSQGFVGRRRCFASKGIWVVIPWILHW